VSVPDPRHRAAPLGTTLWAAGLDVVDNKSRPGDSVTLRPQSRRRRSDHPIRARRHPHRPGDKFCPIHLDRTHVIHNPQALLPLLDMYLSLSSLEAWGHSRKDKLR